MKILFLILGFYSFKVGAFYGVPTAQTEVCQKTLKVFKQSGSIALGAWAFDIGLKNQCFLNLHKASCQVAAQNLAAFLNGWSDKSSAFHSGSGGGLLGSGNTGLKLQIHYKSIFQATCQ